jgi:hypothetical protein
MYSRGEIRGYIGVKYQNSQFDSDLLKRAILTFSFKGLRIFELLAL